ncbi:hypothetical protein HD554DRAFT_2253339 [Boletus coccyginus]|nr:hypothetical protein HD554DRAFT_2253339 [Boletus coccyginus]
MAGRSTAHLLADVCTYQWQESVRNLKASRSLAWRDHLEIKSSRPPKPCMFQARQSQVIRQAWKTYFANVEAINVTPPSYVSDIPTEEVIGPQFGAGVPNALDGRRIRTATYLVGSPAGSWLSSPLAQASFPTVQELIFGHPNPIVPDNSWGGWNAECGLYVSSSDLATDSSLDPMLSSFAPTQYLGATNNSIRIMNCDHSPVTGNLMHQSSNVNNLLDGSALIIIGGDQSSGYTKSDYVARVSGYLANTNMTTDPEYPACLACTIFGHARDRAGETRRSGVSESYFARYCWSLEYSRLLGAPRARQADTSFPEETEHAPGGVLTRFRARIIWITKSCKLRHSDQLTTIE